MSEMCYTLLQSLVGKIERMGISNLIANPGGLSISAGLYARPALTSPMAQLTCLLPSHSSENITHIGQKVPPSTTPVTQGRISVFVFECAKFEMKQ